MDSKVSMNKDGGGHLAWFLNLEIKLIFKLNNFFLLNVFKPKLRKNLWENNDFITIFNFLRPNKPYRS